MTSLRSTYFPQIDGLRAIAVLIATLFHYRIPLFEGGYIGVDIFFVISGFLITAMLFDKSSANDFSFLIFYKKRFYRLYPALLFVSTLTFILACILFSPSHLENAGKNLLGVLTFTSNFVYWKSVSYFQVLNYYDPFVPTWSLGIEMQYYLLFPLFFIPVLKYFKNYSGIIIFFCTLISILLAEVFLRHSNNFVYYNLPFRFFEFGIGSLCFYWLNSGKKGFPFTATLGIFLIILGMFLMNAQTPFPGIWSLPPCIGAAFIIVSNDNGAGYKFLSSRYVKNFGKISYSFYLIHWPVYVLFSYWYFDEIDLWIKLALLMFSAIAAAFTYHFIENSYRHQSIGAVKNALLLFLMMFAIVLAYLSYNNNGWDWRLTTEQKQLQALIVEEEQAFRETYDDIFPAIGESKFIPAKHAGLECSFNNSKDYKILLPCLKYNLQQYGKNGFLIIGDSNGANTYRALKIAYPDTNFAMLQQAGCAASEYLESRRSGNWCFKGLNQVLASLYETRLLKGVILSSRWTLQPYEKARHDNKKYNVPVMILGPTPMLRHDTFETLFMSRTNDYNITKTLYLDGVAFQSDFKLAQDDLSSIEWATYVSKSELLCPGDACPIFVGGTQKPLFLDDQHLSSAGIIYFSDALKNNEQIRSFIELKH